MDGSMGGSAKKQRQKKELGWSEEGRKTRSEKEGRVRGVTCREERIGKYKKNDQRKKRSEWG